MKPKHTFITAAETLIRDGEARVRMGQNSARLVPDYKDRLRCHCAPFFGDTPLANIDSAMLRRFRDELVAKGLKQATVLVVMSFVSKTLRMAHDDGLIRQMPAIPRKGQKPSPRPAFTAATYTKLLTTLKQVEKGKPVIAFKGNRVDWELRAIVTFMVNTFTRPGDVFALKNEHIIVVPEDADGPAYLRIDAPSSKGHEAPIISMPVAVPVYQRTIERHRKAGFGKPDDYVFLPSKKKRAYAHELVRRQFRLVLKHAGLLQSTKGVEHSLYSLRHTAITLRLLHAKDLDLLTLARTARTSVEMIDRFYASSLTAELNRDKLHSFRRPTRFLTDGVSPVVAKGSCA
ncbi:hypothetical protein [Brevundimonas sp.]|uniref:tyrosine-type recombinase/integrase n=1 Tax=Brevundimonas sp. TaxID=1871086 RepID=UPI002D30B22D|nr:hypothetical protein [Brevundimonas sp.]HYC97042.1 hypothetical protein [Brevundimonas sp.]